MCGAQRILLSEYLSFITEYCIQCSPELLWSYAEWVFVRVFHLWGMCAVYLYEQLSLCPLLTHSLSLSLHLCALVCVTLLAPRAGDGQVKGKAYIDADVMYVCLCICAYNFISRRVGYNSIYLDTLCQPTSLLESESKLQIIRFWGNVLWSDVKHE